MTHHFQDSVHIHGELIQLLLFISLFFISWYIKNIYGVLFKYKKWKHAFVNAPFIFTNFPGQLILGIAFVRVIKWTSVNHFGLLHYFHIEKNPIMLFVATFILLDLGEYVYHIIMHNVPSLWRFHLVHHSDNMVDVSTTLREHPVENIIRLSFTLIWVFFLNLIYQAMILYIVDECF